jgi:predicted permease
MNSFVQDIRYGIQMMLKHPGFTLVAVLTLALGVGANTALFSVVDAVLLKKLPVVEPDRLVLFKQSYNAEKFGTGGYNGSNPTDPNTGLRVGTSFPIQTVAQFREFTKDPQSVLSDVFAFSPVDMNLNTGTQAVVVNGQAVSGNYFAALGVTAFVGRTITDADDNAGAAPVAVLSYQFWTRHFGNDTSIVGRQVNINNVAFTVAGITPPGFEGTSQVGSSQDLTIPIAWEPQISGSRSMMAGAGIWWLRMMGRLKPGATIEQAQATFSRPFLQSVNEHRAARQSKIQTSLRTLEPNDYPRLGVESGSQGEMNSRRAFAKPLRLLFGVVGLVLLIACANVANLLLVRASSRRKEIAVRLALGASRWRLVRQLLTESLLLSVIGGGLGIIFALWIKDGLLVATEWGGREMSGLNTRLDWRVLAFTFGVALVTGVVFGLAPALRATRLDLTPSLKDSGRGTSLISRSLLTRSLVVVQVSLSVLLLIGAGLLIRTLRNLQNVETGFNAQNLLLFSVEPSLIGYKEEKLANLYQQLSTRVEAVPGVRSATFSKNALLSGGGTNSDVFVSGLNGPDGKPLELGIAYIHNVRENFMQTMEIPLLRGRSLTAHDNARAPQVAVVNESFARRYLQNENPIGKRFSFDAANSSEIEIVGLVRDAKYMSQRDDVPPTVYQSWSQSLNYMRFATFEVRAEGDPSALIPSIRQAVREVDPNLPVTNIKTQIEQADEQLSMERMFAKLLTLFGLVAQVLAAVGLYGVMAYSVSQRTQEIGIRMALGANRGKVLRMVLRQGMTLTIFGVAVGIVAAFVLTKYLESLTSMLFGVQPRDPFTFGITAVLLTLVALVACIVPARRATKVDPLEALRYE